MEKPDQDYAHCQGFTITFTSDQNDDYSRTGSAFQDFTEETPPSRMYPLGYVLDFIIGQHDPGTICGREMVSLVRDPFNRDNYNAIKVVNTRTVQVAYLSRSVANVLAPLMDRHVITVKGIMGPNIRLKGNKCEIRFELYIFTCANRYDCLQKMFDRSNELVLMTTPNVGFSLSESVAMKQRTKHDEIRRLDEIFNLVDKKLREKIKINALEPPKEVIKSELFQHQKEGLGWLFHRENSEDLPPFWEENGRVYQNVLTNCVSDRRPTPLQGGLFADDTGLGKTLTLLSLIALDNSHSIYKTWSRSSVMVENYENAEVVSLSDKKVRRGSKDDFKSLKSRSRTLIVCPPSVMSTWQTQLEEHTIDGSLKMYLYYGTDRTSNATELSKYDIVLTTYSILSAEQTSWDSSPIGKIEWWRVILDEAHAIKNVEAKQSKAVTSLRAKRRWFVTGTPIQNDPSDLFSLMVFLHFEPFSIKSYWNRLFTYERQKGLPRLKTLMAMICLRRTKDKSLIELPKKTIETFFVDLSSEERTFYDQMEREAQNHVQDCIKDDILMCNYSTVLSIILRLRQICISSVLLPPDLKSILPTDKLEDVSNSPELLKKILEVIQDDEEFECPICLYPPKDIIITRCTHVFCKHCILKTLSKANKNSNCPLCRQPLSESDLFSVPAHFNTPETSHSSMQIPQSTKITALLQLLKASVYQNPNGKSVVFSHFKKLLPFLENTLRASGFETLTLDVYMNAKKRAQVIDQFGALPSPTVLLASLKSAGTGINLTCASTVYLMEPWLNPATDEQAMNRVHRIGQTENVKIVRLIVRDTIEERVLELKEKKKKKNLLTESLNNPKDQKEARLEDVRILLAL